MLTLVVPVCADESNDRGARYDQGSDQRCPTQIMSFNNFISNKAYYGEWHGHKTEHLLQIFDVISPKKYIIWLAGDSSLDNKYWLLKDEKMPAVNGFEKNIGRSNVKTAAL